MNEKQFARHIGDVDDQLVRQAEQLPNYRDRHRRNRNRKLAALAAVAALMVCSFGVGARAFAETVYVEKEPESIDLEAFGISLILPDDWAGKYGYERMEGGDLRVYSLAAREEETADGTAFQGSLFWVECIDGQYPMDMIYPQPGYTIAATAAHTYRLVLASDVQYDPQNARAAEEYTTLYDSIPRIKILLSDWLTESSTNPANWVQGTVYVEHLGHMTADGQAVEKTTILDEAASAAASRIILGQDYSIENASFPVDLVFLVAGQRYHMNSQTGQIFGVGGVSAVLSGEDLQTLLSLVEGA